MTSRDAPDGNEGLIMIQELEDRLKEHVDKLEHIRLAATDLRDTLSGNYDDMRLCISEHMDWLQQLSGRMEILQTDTSVFVQMNVKPRNFRGNQQGPRIAACWGRAHLTDNAQSEYGWSPVRTRRSSDAASEMSCAW